MKTRMQTLFVLFCALLLPGQTALTVFQPAPVAARQADAQPAVAAAGCFEVRPNVYLPLAFVTTGAGHITARTAAVPTALEAMRCLVPDVVGLQEALARAEIVGAQLSPGNSVYEASSSVAAAGTLRMTRPAATAVDPGSMVNVVVSTGPELVAVPDLVEMTQAEAEAAVAGAGLEHGQVSTEASASVPAGRERPACRERHPSQHNGPAP